MTKKAVCGSFTISVLFCMSSLILVNPVSAQSQNESENGTAVFDARQWVEQKYLLEILRLTNRSLAQSPSKDYFVASLAMLPHQELQWPTHVDFMRRIQELAQIVSSQTNVAQEFKRSMRLQMGRVATLALGTENQEQFLQQLDLMLSDLKNRR